MGGSGRGVGQCDPGSELLQRNVARHVQVAFRVLGRFSEVLAILCSEMQPAHAPRRRLGPGFRLLTRVSSGLRLMHECL